MTSSGKVRIYELSRDLGLDNKDVIDAAEKLAITVRSHSSSISDDEAARTRAVEALIASDFAPVQGFVLAMAIVYILLNLLIDLSYRLIDPRMSAAS